MGRPYRKSVMPSLYPVSGYIAHYRCCPPCGKREEGNESKLLQTTDSVVVIFFLIGMETRYIFGSQKLKKQKLNAWRRLAYHLSNCS